jgi:hypothetical protein
MVFILGAGGTGFFTAAVFDTFALGGTVFAFADF